jgi:hypothetical protein
MATNHLLYETLAHPLHSNNTTNPLTLLHFLTSLVGCEVVWIEQGHTLRRNIPSLSYCSEAFVSLRYKLRYNPLNRTLYNHIRGYLEPNRIFGCPFFILINACVILSNKNNNKQHDLRFSQRYQNYGLL